MASRMKIENKMYDVINIEECSKSDPSLFNRYTAIKTSNGNVYPIRVFNENLSGFYKVNNMLYQLVLFKDDDQNKYIPTSNNYIDYDSVENIKQMIENSTALNNMQKSILTSVDNVFAPIISETDTPEMKAIKTCILSKYIDISKYEERFGSSFTNDIRMLKRNSISFDKLRLTCKALDLDAKLIISDKNKDVANPMNKEVTVDIINDIIDTKDV